MKWRVDDTLAAVALSIFGGIILADVLGVSILIAHYIFGWKQ